METVNSTGAFICFAILIAMSLKQVCDVNAQLAAETTGISTFVETVSDSSSSITNSVTTIYHESTGAGDSPQSTAATSTSISKSSEMSLESTSTTVTSESTTVLPFTDSISTSRSSTTAEISTTTMSAKSTTENKSVEFHTIMIVMIVVLGFVIVFSVLCGVLTLCGVDIGCPLPCCGGGGSNKMSHSGSPLKMSSKRSRNLSSQRLNEEEEFHELDSQSSIKIGEPTTHYNEGYNIYEEATSPAYASSKITLSQEESISVSL